MSFPAKQYFAEVTRALSVLAILLFALMPGASPDSASAYSQIGASPAVAIALLSASQSQLCGGGWGDDQLGHAACHACRGNIPVLPAAPCVAEPAFLSVISTDYAALAERSLLPTFAPRPPSQGPPAA
jgi:hypothetical protein